MASNAVEMAAVPVAQALSQSELDRARLYLEQTKVLIGGALRNLSQAQWNYKPSPDRWSIAEIVEHVIFVQEQVLGPIREKLESAPVTPVRPDCKQVDDVIIYQIPSRLAKFPSPAQPSGGLGLAEALDRLPANYGRLAERLEKTPGLRERSIESRPLRAISNGAYDMMDGYQWILAVAAHTERHTKQVVELMADPGFPV
ncbi:MAG: hypothetical protein C5B51_27090 [Terriglobia bacterium]|nr:MAG: hypothetical protein C5B51_27090 [Terriglobia bacterium]